MPQPEPPTSALLYHLALRHEWSDAAASAGGYRRSTLGLSLDEVGFIHCSFADQTQTVADRFYRGRADVVLLTIDPALLPDPVKVERPDGGDEAFPHLYGPLPVAAVIGVTPVAVSADGRLAVPGGRAEGGTTFGVAPRA